MQISKESRAFVAPFYSEANPFQPPRPSREPRRRELADGGFANV